MLYKIHEIDTGEKKKQNSSENLSAVREDKTTRFNLVQHNPTSDSPDSGSSTASLPAKDWPTESSQAEADRWPIHQRGLGHLAAGPRPGRSLSTSELWLDTSQCGAPMRVIYVQRFRHGARRESESLDECFAFNRQTRLPREREREVDQLVNNEPRQNAPFFRYFNSDVLVIPSDLRVSPFFF